MDGAPRLMSMTNVRALSRYRAQRERQALRVMQADAAARDHARKALDVAAAALAAAEQDRSVGEQGYYRDLDRTANVTLDMLYRRRDELARLTEAVQGATVRAEAAGAALAARETELIRSTSAYRARLREVRKSHLLQERLEGAIRSRMELADELATEEQNSTRHANKSGERRNWP
jgi:hypothetical protein